MKMKMFKTDREMTEAYGPLTALYDVQKGEYTIYTTDGLEWHRAGDGTWYEMREAESFYQFAEGLYDFLKANCTDERLPSRNPISDPKDITERRLAQWQRLLMRT